MAGFFKAGESFGKKPLPTVAQCGACGLYKGCKSPKMPVSGKGQREVLIVAESPGEEEDKRGLQLVGNSGRELEKVVDRAGFDLRRDCWLTNALICYPGDSTVQEQAVDYCRPNLLTALRTLRPKTVILLGGKAVKSLIGHLWKPDTGGITTWAGWQIPSGKYNCWVCPTYNPAYLLREKSEVLDREFAQHVRTALRLENRPWEKPPDYKSRAVPVEDGTEAARLVSRMMREGPGVFAFDYETNMLKPDSQNAKIVSCSIYRRGDENAYAFPMRGRVVELVRTFLRDPQYKKVASNMKFEDRWSKAVLGVRVKGWRWDTMLTAHLLDNRGGISSIKFQAFVRLGFGVYDEKISPYLKADFGNSENTIHKLNTRELLVYNALDSLLEMEVAERQASDLGFEL